MKTKIMIIFLAFTGCATHKLVMVKEDGSNYSQRDDGTCRAQALSARANSNVFDDAILRGIDDAEAQREVFKNCMIGKGYKVGQ